MLGPGGVAEAALGDAAEQLHLPTLEERGEHLGAGAGVLALGAARGGLAVPAADAAADALLLAALVNALVDVAQVHAHSLPAASGVVTTASRRAAAARPRACAAPSGRRWSP